MSCVANIVACFLVLGFVLGNAQSQQKDAQTVAIESIVRAWKSRQDRIRTFRFEWTERYTAGPGYFERAKTKSAKDKSLDLPTNATTYDTSYIFVVDAEKIRYAAKHLHIFEDRVGLQNTTWVSSGKIWKEFRPKDNLPYPHGIIAEGKVAAGFVNKPTLLPVIMNFRPFSPLTNFFDKMAERFKVAPGRASIEGASCLLLEEKRSTGPSEYIAVDPDRDFIILRRAMMFRGQVFTQMTFSEYKKESFGWVPHQWSIVFLEGDGSVLWSTRAKVHKYALNITVDPGEFELDFPPGTWVFDGLESKKYICKEGGKKRLITEQEINGGASYEQLLNTESGKALSSEPPSRGGPWLAMPLMVLLVLLVLLVLFTLWRRRVV